MKNYQENIVPSSNQNRQSFFEDYRKEDLKILFVGNSITKHGPKPEINWYNDCGMAASKIENDYVHIIKQSIRKTNPDASFAILQVANFEREFETFDICKNYSIARDFRADIILMFFGANVPEEYSETEKPEVTFGEKYEALRNYLESNPNVKFIHSQGFYIKPQIDAEKEEVSRKYNDTFVNIDDIRTRVETHGEFNHPNDLGMRLLAERFLKYINELLSL